MSEIYERIESLCKKSGINITIMCKETEVPRSALSDYKAGRTKSLSTATLSKIAVYFGVSVDYLLGNEQKEKPTAAKTVSDDDIKFALFGDVGVSDEDFEDVKRFAEFIKNKKKE